MKKTTINSVLDQSEQKTIKFMEDCAVRFLREHKVVHPEQNSVLKDSYQRIRKLCKKLCGESYVEKSKT